MNYSLQDLKQQLRRDMLEKRRSLSSIQVAAQSGKIAAALSSWSVYRAAGTVMFYLAMPEEPQTLVLIEEALLNGKRVCVPLLGKTFGDMSAAEITDLDCLITGRLGLKMPDPAKAKIINPETMDLIIVPGVAFDRFGGRLGLGAGYYDRFLKKALDSIFVGFAWDCQLIPKVPDEAHDIKMHYLLTETCLLKCSR